GARKGGGRPKNTCYSIQRGTGNPCAPETSSYGERCRRGSRHKGLRTLPTARRLPASPKPPNEAVSCAVPLSQSHPRTGAIDGWYPDRRQFLSLASRERKRPELPSGPLRSRPAP